MRKDYDELKKLTGGEEIKSQLSAMQRKIQDIKDEFGSIDVIKMHYTEKVMIINIFSFDIAYVCTYIYSRIYVLTLYLLIFSNDKMHIL